VPENTREKERREDGRERDRREWCWRLTPIISAIPEAEIRGITVRSQSGQIMPA
jgi:hypothetical protein